MSKPTAIVYVDGFNLYRRALESNPKIVIHKGQFRSDIKLMPVVPWEFDEIGNPVTVKVRKRKEKGSDVNNVGLILPTENSSKKLKLIAEPSIHYLRKTALFSAQFPDVIFDSKGAIMKPLAW
ncbi:MAG: hypothetical protein Q8L08_06800 [Candidatus Nanopelagicaceae bacterium]|nr:hypothetical protein [Candidatus Nanopelagicaceae bacterium]